MLVMVGSRILGYVRDIIIYSHFGQNRITDAYNAAFSVPDFLYMLLVGGALSSAFIPVFSGYIARKQQEEAWEVASIVFNLVLVLLAGGIGIGILLAPQLVDLIVPGFEAEYKVLTVRMTRIMFLQVLFLSMAGITQGILHSFKHFRTPALGSLLYNVGIIAVGLLLVRSLGIVAFSVGVVAGAAINLAVQLPALLRHRVRYRRLLDLSNPGVRRVLALMIPILVGQSVIYLNLFVTQNLASSLDGGMIAALKLAERLMKLPVAVIGISMAVALFPNLTEFAAVGNMKRYHTSLQRTLSSVIFLAVPAGFGLAVLGRPLIRMMYQQGAFDGAATAATATALVFFSLGIPAYSSIHVLSRAYYALEDTRTPVIISCLSMLVNLGFSLWLIRPLGHGGLALAYSLTGLMNAAALLWFLRKKTGPLGGRALARVAGKTLAASLLMAASVSGTVFVLERVVDVTAKSGQLLTAILAGGVGAGTFWLAAMAANLEEEREIRRLILGRFSRPRRV